MKDNPKIIVRFAVQGFHHWPEPSVNRSYLGNRHRHLFHVEVETSVLHENREVEFHDLHDEAWALFPGGELGGQSCEMLARALAESLRTKLRRPVTVTVFEDNEMGARVSVD